MKEKAREWAVTRHADQMYGVHPYSVHLDAVAHITQPFGEEAETVAYLHDVVEDTDATLDQVRAEFGDLIASCIAILTDEQGESRKERKVKTYQKMSVVTGDEELALIVKAADRLANVQACVKDNNEVKMMTYQSEHLVFKKAVYRQGLCDQLWYKLNTILEKSN